MSEENKRRRAIPEVRRDEIRRAALRASNGVGYMLVTQKQIADEAKCSPALVAKYFGCMASMPAEIMRAAVDYCHAEVVLQGLAIGDEVARAAPEALRIAAKNRLDLEL